MKKIIIDENNFVLKIIATPELSNGIDIFNDNHSIFDIIQDITDIIDKFGNKRLKFFNKILTKIDPVLNPDQERKRKEIELNKILRQKYTDREEKIILMKGILNSSNSKFVEYVTDVNNAIAEVNGS